MINGDRRDPEETAILGQCFLSVLEVMQNYLDQVDFVYLPKEEFVPEDLMSYSKSMANPQREDYQEQKKEFITIVHPMMPEPTEMVRVLLQTRDGQKECLLTYRDGKDPLRSFKGICMMENGAI